MTTNQSLTDELEAVNSIYNVGTLSVISSDESSMVTVLALPDLPFSFYISFPHEYPDAPPQIVRTESTGPTTKKGEGEAALSVLRDVLGKIFTPGQVCLFDLIEEVTSLLQQGQDIEEQQYDGSSQNPSTTPTHRSASTTPLPLNDLSNLHINDSVSDTATTAATSIPEPNWALSQPLLVSKSSFVGRALQVDDLRSATSALAHLLTTNKKVAAATHNITAWRIKSRASEDAPEITVQDCDDDGETAAGGRLLHLLQLMDVWNVMVVVTRWYGGVKMGPDRFRVVNVVARDALVRGGFAKDEGEISNKGKGKKKK